MVMANKHQGVSEARPRSQVDLHDQTLSARRLMATLSLAHGQVAEWFKALAWKACVPPKGTAGSNPALSVI